MAVAVRSETGYLAASIDLWDGRKVRCGPDEADDFNVPTKIEFETQIPGGFGPGSITLPRPDGFDPLDVDFLLAGVRVYDESNRTVYEGRVTGTPQVGANEIELQLEGWAAHLEADETAKVVFVDRDLSKWQGVSRARRISLLSSSIDPIDATFDVVPDSLTPALQTGTQGTWSRAWRCDPFYDALSGLKIASVDYAFTAGASVNTADANLSVILYSSTDDNFANTEASVELKAASGSGSFTPTTARRFVIIEHRHNTTGGADNVLYPFYWTKLGNHGDHGVTKQGTAPDRGYLVSDMVRYAVQTWAPLLRVAADSIEATSFVVPHAVFAEDSTAKAIIEALVLFGGSPSYPLDWGVYDDKTFFLKSPGNYGQTWRVRRDEGAEPQNQGPDSGELINGVRVTYRDGSATKTVGPIGSGSDTETASLQITDPDHPRNRIGERAWRNLNTGVTNLDGGTLLGQLYLAEKNRQEWRGDVEVKGEQRDGANNYQPPYMIRAGDTAVLEDDSDTRERRIVGTSYDSEKRSTRLSIGAAPDRLDVLLARAGVVVETLGVT